MIPEDRVGYIRFALREVRAIKYSALLEFECPSLNKFHWQSQYRTWMANVVSECERAEGYINQALGEEVTDGESTDKEGTIEGARRK